MKNDNLLQADDITPELVIDQAFIENRPLSASSLKAFRKSPKHYIQYLEKPFAPGPAFILGSLVDCLTLEPEKFEKKFKVFEKPNLRSNAGKEEMAIIEAAAVVNRQTLVSKEQVATAKICVEALYSHEMSLKLIEGRKHVQRKLSWRNKKHNLPLIGYQDFESNVWGERFIVDLKTANNSDPDQFTKDAAKWEYEIQAATYLDAYHKKYFQFPYFIFLVVETVEPFNVSVNFCDTKYIERAKNEFMGTLTAFRYCMDKNLFNSGYEFRLFGTLDYFSLEIPRYKKQLFTGFEGEETK